MKGTVANICMFAVHQLYTCTVGSHEAGAVALTRWGWGRRATWEWGRGRGSHWRGWGRWGSHRGWEVLQFDATLPFQCLLQLMAPSTELLILFSRGK